MASRTPRQTQDYRLEEIDNELLLYHPTKTKTVYLNETAGLVWKLVDGARSSSQISHLLADAFPESTTTINRQVEETLDRLAEEGVIEFL